jgi:hypothetical protein
MIGVLLISAVTLLVAICVGELIAPSQMPIVNTLDHTCQSHETGLSFGL